MPKSSISLTRVVPIAVAVALSLPWAASFAHAGETDGELNALESLLRMRRDNIQRGDSARRGASERPSFGFGLSGPALGYAALEDQPAPKSAEVDEPTYTVWFEGYGDWEHRGRINSFDFASRQNTYGSHGGVDHTWRGVFSGDDALVVGLLGSWMDSNVTFFGAPVVATFSGPGVGGYAVWVDGGASANLVIKSDFLDFRENFLGTAPGFGLRVVNFSARGDVQYKFMLDEQSFVEPTGGAFLTRTIFGDNASAFGLRDATTLRLQTGLRVGTSFEAHGLTFEPSLTGLVFSNVVAQGTSATTYDATSATLSLPLAPTDQGRARGEVLADLDVGLPNGYSLYVQGGARFGGELVGGSAKIGFRARW